MISLLRFQLEWRLLRFVLQSSSLMVLLLVLCSASVALAQQSSPPFDLNQVPAPVSPPIANSGHAIYQNACAPCHGVQGMGDGPTAKDLPGPATKFADPESVWEKSPAQLFHTTKFGRLEKRMPPWQKELTDAQIWQAVAYAWTLHTDQAFVDAGRDLYTVSCLSCHGERGAGDGPKATAAMRNLGDPAYAMTRSQMDWQKGWQSAHADIGAEWSLDNKRKVLEYIRSFSYVPPWESPYRPGVGVISGQATQRTAGGAVAALPIALEAFVDFQRVAVFTSTLSADGQFQFQNLAVNPGIVYMASVSAEGVSYSSPILSLTPETATLTTTIQIFGTTEDDRGIKIDRAHWIIDSQPGALIIGEIFDFSNTLDRTYVGKRVAGIDAPVTIALPIPPGAQEITFENGALGDRFQQQGNLIYDTTPVIPGESTRQIIMRYALPYQGTSVQLEQTYRYPIAMLNLLITELPQLQAEVTTLTALGRQNLQNSSYQLWQGLNLPPGKIPVALSGLPEAGSSAPRPGPTNSASAGGAMSVSILESWAMWVMGALIGVSLGGVWAWSWRQGLLRPALHSGALGVRREALLTQIAKLDDLHELEKINDSAWQQERSRLKIELLTLEGKLNELGRK